VDNGAVGLRRILDTVVDRVELSERDGGEWVELTKTIERTGGMCGGGGKLQRSRPGSLRNAAHSRNVRP